MGSELERYLRLEPQETEDPIEWWMAHQGQFPMISQLALDMLAIPAMATDCERSFSLAKLTLTTQRLSMTTETLEKLQCLKNWVRHGAVKLGATIVLRVIKYLKYDPGFDLFDLRAALTDAVWDR
ncbi:Putative AC transposase [Fusarium oxysporum f. sp. cubense race 1]|uniref:Putative AC transposase n=1 Tax=Fusarium oxysporum f. sp. cubense (strain race 1) TaxID=1229664 RepID=N4U292_FUSC1|nr:Putative AC transposase [Fusarium oxysporum f. sp. cubense race 1]